MKNEAHEQTPAARVETSVPADLWITHGVTPDQELVNAQGELAWRDVARSAAFEIMLEELITTHGPSGTQVYVAAKANSDGLHLAMDGALEIDALERFAHTLLTAIAAARAAHPRLTPRTAE